MALEEGFPGQRLRVLPAPLVASALTRPVTSQLLVSDAGFYPEARSHRMRRPTGVGQLVLLICTTGRGWCELDGVRHAVEAGQAVLIPPGQSHSYGADRDDPWTLWWMHVLGGDLGQFVRSAGLTVADPVRDLDDEFRVVALVDDVLRAMERDQAQDSLLTASGAAWYLLSLLSSSRPAGFPRLSAVDAAREHLRAHFTEKLSVADLAKLARLSPSHFAAVFRRQTGNSPLRYQTQLRMTRARELLDTTDLPVAEVSARVGYDDPFYFSRQFKSVHGLTPMRYRGHAKG